MKCERRQPTCAEWARITSRRPVLRKIPPLAKPGKEWGVDPKRWGDDAEPGGG